MKRRMVGGPTGQSADHCFPVVEGPRRSSPSAAASARRVATSPPFSSAKATGELRFTLDHAVHALSQPCPLCFAAPPSAVAAVSRASRRARASCAVGAHAWSGRALAPGQGRWPALTCLMEPLIPSFMGPMA